MARPTAAPNRRRDDRDDEVLPREADGLLIPTELEDGGLLFYAPDFLAPAEADGFFARLTAEIPWSNQVLRIAGRSIPEPRLTAWFGDPEASYRYSGLARAPLPWTPLLRELRDRVAAAAEAPLNSVLLNLYRTGADSVGFHADAEPELGRNPVIASLSLGEVRRFVLKHKRRKDVAPIVMELSHGSLLVMAGTTQHHYRHAVPKDARVTGSRINLTFRNIVRISRRDEESARQAVPEEVRNPPSKPGL